MASCFQHINECLYVVKSQLRSHWASISVLEAFNDVRNNKSLAHDNPILNYEESLLIFNHVAASIRFIKALETKIKAQAKVAEQQAARFPWDESIPF